MNVHVDASWKALNMKARSLGKVMEKMASVPQHDDQANNTIVKERISVTIKETNMNMKIKANRRS